MVPIIPSIAKILSSLFSLSWPSLSSSFPLVITILVANVFIFRPRLTEQRIRRRAGGARGTQQSHSPAGARAPEPKEGEEEEEKVVKEEAAAGSCLILPGSADPLAAAGWGWPPGDGPRALRSCPRPPLARCARSRVVSGRRPGDPHAPRRGSAGGPAATATTEVGRPPGCAQSGVHRLGGKRRGPAGSGSLRGRGTWAVAIRTG